MRGVIAKYKENKLMILMDKATMEQLHYHGNRSHLINQTNIPSILVIVSTFMNSDRWVQKPSQLDVILMVQQLSNRPFLKKSDLGVF